jgi:hypothetical protein
MFRWKGKMEYRWKVEVPLEVQLSLESSTIAGEFNYRWRVEGPLGNDYPKDVMNHVVTISAQVVQVLSGM